ncbi:ABC transporter ATP-binding protein [Agromyces mediolanus]|uniref:ABC transporter ATP-binding protein n=1 Tax=Agromyces mediolanus TaxID=41986 RepID=UPI0020408BC6|nr:ABC transporter ATP-binding protein [Agromyces mediolanus]MCM3658305.1 ABC transporter ATP-binding protein [Agromyces mediolanus]
MLISLEQVSHEFLEGRALFQPLSASFDRGELIAITGPSGAGKSTLLAILAGLMPPTHGRIRRPGSPRACWVTQHPHGVARRTALDHVCLPYLATGMRRRDAEPLARALLDRFGLSAVGDQQFATLSGGQAQRLMIARSIAAAPDLLLLDEPTAQLDQRTAGEVDAALGAIASTDLLVFVATHSAGTRAMCSRVVELEAPLGCG